MIKYLLLFLFCFISYISNSQVVVREVNNLTDVTNIATYCIDDSSGYVSVQNKAFTQGLPSLDDKLGHTVWYKFQLINKSGQNLLLGVTNPTIDSLKIFFASSSQTDSVRMGDKFLFNERKYKDRIFIADIPPFAGTLTVLLKVNLKELTDVPILIGNRESFLVDLHAQNIFSAFVAGAVIIMVLYNLFIFFGTKEYTYLIYSISQSTALFVIMTLDGHSYEYFWPDFPKINDFIPAFVAINSIFSVFFFINFVNLKQNDPKWIRFFWGIIFMLFIVIALNFASFYSQASILYELNTLVSIFFELYVSFRVINKGYKPARYFIIGYGLYSLAGVLYILYNLNVLPENFPVDAIIKLSVLAEASFLSLAMADKLNFFKEENGRIIKEQNIFLEKSVKERTWELHLANQQQEAANEELTMLNEELNTTLESVESEKTKSERLLLNILPEAVAGELKEKGRATPKYYDNVSILFADFVNFTQFAEKNSPENLIKQLDPLFLSFDLICEKYNLEKIKTIGDCYMAAGGLPVENETNAIDALKAAVEMLEMIKKTSWALRIGIHTGPVVAGVIGINKFAYDVWGDTVNVAARMEQSSESNRINISRQTYELVKNDFPCTFRGKLAAKNKGKIDMYFVDDPTVVFTETVVGISAKPKEIAED